MCLLLAANELIEDQMKHLYNIIVKKLKFQNILSKRFNQNYV